MAYDIKRLPSEASVDHDHEASLHDIKRLPDRKSTRLNSSHNRESRMPSSA